jgi:3-carboxy-cis,cis-muconate cycloisomerase
MPHKQNPVAAIAILGCTRRVPGLAATLIAAAEQEHQRAAGAWHAEWEPFADLLRVTGSAASWAAELAGALVVDPARMRANLDATRGLPLAERVAGRCGHHQCPDRRGAGPGGLPRRGRDVHRRRAGRARAAVLAGGLNSV